MPRSDKSSAPGQSYKDARKFRDHIDRELWNVERKAPKPSERFKELLFNATRICARGKNDKNPIFCIHAAEAEPAKRGGEKKVGAGVGGGAGPRHKNQSGRQRPDAYAPRQPGQYVCSPVGFR